MSLLGRLARVSGGVAACVMGGPISADQARFTAFADPAS
jgi:hypothetical protein